MSEDNEIKKQELELEKYKARLSVWRTGIIGGSVTIITALLSAIVSITTSYLENQQEIDLEHTRSLIKTEQDYNAKFIEYALMEDVASRLRFAEYFKTMAPSNEHRQRWNQYYLLVDAEYQKLEKELESVKVSIEKIEIVSELQESTSANNK